MKKILLMVAIVLFITNTGTPQDSEPAPVDGVKFGVKIGTNYSNVYDTKGEDFDADPKFGLAAGIFLSIPVIKYIGIQPEALFSQKGFKGEGHFLNAPYIITRTTNYIDFPLLAALKPTENISILAGPQYSYLISQKNKFENAVTTIEQEEEFDNENIRKNTFCFTGGIDINLDKLVVGGRVGWDLFRNNGDGTTTTPRYKNVWYQVTLGYIF